MRYPHLPLSGMSRGAIVSLEGTAPRSLPSVASTKLSLCAGVHILELTRLDCEAIHRIEVMAFVRDLFISDSVFTQEVVHSHRNACTHRAPELTLARSGHGAGVNWFSIAVIIRIRDGGLCRNITEGA